GALEDRPLSDDRPALLLHFLDFRADFFRRAVGCYRNDARARLDPARVEGFLLLLKLLQPLVQRLQSLVEGSEDGLDFVVRKPIDKGPLLVEVFGAGERIARAVEDAIEGAVVIARNRVVLSVGA